MPVNINGSTGISGVDGSAGTPAIQGSDTNTGVFFGTNTIDLSTDGTSRLSIDSSGRLLVGTITAVTGASSQHSYLQILGGSSGQTQATMNLCRNENSADISLNELIGEIYFCDKQAGEYAKIKVNADSGAGSGDYPGRMEFHTTADAASSPTERFRIASGGQPFFRSEFSGVTSAIANNATSGDAIFRGRHSATAVNNGTLVFQVNADGDCENANNSYTGFSDIKLKENIQDAGSQWDDLKALRVRKYNFKEETGHQTHTQIGLVAQEVEPICPGLVSESIDRDENDVDLGTVTKSVNYSVLYMKAVKALQEAMERIETLETRLTALEGGTN